MKHLKGSRSILMMLMGGVLMHTGAQALPVKSKGMPVEAVKSFAPIVEPLLPAVVNISTTTDSGPARRRDFGFPSPGIPLEEIFKHFMEEYQQRPRKATSLGSGFIIRQKEKTVYVVTCYHVIADADEIKVTLNNGKEFKAQVVGKDRRTDLAVVKFETKETLTIAKWGDSSQSKVGDWVIAIGNPFGLSSTVTTGIVSSIARDIGSRSRGMLSSIVDGFIQTDASINLGNSGGPMFNADGYVIGINTAIYSPNGGSIGIGFAIPSSMAEAAVEKLISEGHAFSGWLGVMVQKISPEMAESVGLKEPRGALISGVTPKGPADQAKLLTGDVILKFNGSEINESTLLPSLVARCAVNTSVPVIVFRDGKELTLQVTVGDYEKAEKEGLINNDEVRSSKALKSMKKILGLNLQTLSVPMKERFALSDTVKGCVIVGIDPDSEAAEKGLRPGDVIQEITTAGKKTLLQNEEDFETVIKQAKKAGQRQVLLLVLRQNITQFVTLSIQEGEENKTKSSLSEKKESNK